MKAELESKFKEIYGKEAAATYTTPGRVNLIGEHIDYNGGLVLPCAITLGTMLSIAPNDDHVIRFSSMNFPQSYTIEVKSSYQKSGTDWYNYPLGVIECFQLRGKNITGFDFLFNGTIPIGSGLSSSAAIEVVTAYALNDYMELGFSRLDLVLLCKDVENKFMGVNSGIMDQFAVAFGESEKAILLNCDTLKFQLIDCYLGKYSLAVINTNKSRKLSESKYNERVAECQQALADLQQEITIHNLCELTGEKLALHKHLINDPTVLNRATHVVTENDRVILAAKALNERNITLFGKLMYASHESLRTLYDVSGLELDTIVDYCATFEHVIGARMTGAGFGGCAIALVETEYIEEFRTGLTAYYTEKVGYEPSVYISEVGDGAKKI
ncbi:MAG: galactokinase [Pedobacter sp.]|jgi:galactokinase|nr:galactokinase [Pedobacter sp.]